jgi:hypothetical protein
MQTVRENITLSTGRVIGHTRQENGAQLATPLTGPLEMTNFEWIEYCAIIDGRAKNAKI